MSKNSYDQFFKKAQELKHDELAGQVKDRVRFQVKPPPAPSSPKNAATREAASEARLRQALNARPRKARAPFPWRAMVGLSLTLAAGLAYLAMPDKIENLLSKVEISALGQAAAADKASPKKDDGKAAEKSTAASKAEKVAGVDGKSKSSDEDTAENEDIGNYEKLRQRKEELDAREKELNELEEELQKQKVELDKRITQLEDMRNEIGQTLKDRVEVDQEKVTKLVDLYSNMKPKQAADVISSINEDLAVEVLAKMKKKNAAEIMNLLTPEKARVLSEKYTGYLHKGEEPKG
jgi:flagellar motility protein MotE (MotC chaperone)